MDPSQILAQILAAAGASASQVPADIDLSLGNILRAVFILIVVYLAARFVRGLLRRGFQQTKFDKRVEQLVVQVVYYGIIGLGIIWILGGFGLSVVILGIAVGFAFKDLIQNFAAGLLIMGTRPFQLGDWIIVNSNEGRVAEIGWRGTFLDTFDGKRVIIPNSTIITSVVTNNSLQPQLRSALNLQVDLSSDFASVEKYILDALKNIEGIATNPPPSVLLDSITGQAMNLAILIWITEPGNRQKRVVSDALRAIKDALPAHDIDLNPDESPRQTRRFDIGRGDSSPATSISMARSEKPK